MLLWEASFCDRFAGAGVSNALIELFLGEVKRPQAPSSRIACSVFGMPSSLITRFRL